MHSAAALECECSPCPDRRGEGGNASGTGGDGAGGNLSIVGMGEHHVLVAIMFFGDEPHLSPLPSEKGDHVGRRFVSRQGIALADGVDTSAPVGGSDIRGVVIERIEIKARAMAREVAGISRRVRPFPAHHGQVEHEGIE